MIQSAMTSNTSSSNESRASASVANADSSFIISTNTNLAQQGSPIPVGYGRLRTGGYIIQSTVKSYPKSQEIESVLAADPTSVQITTNTY
jgi:predicted phage tail protein